MSSYRPEHQPWHDKIPVACTCLPGWSTREMVDPGCEYHCVIEVLDEYGFGSLLGETLYRKARHVSNDTTAINVLEAGSEKGWFAKVRIEETTP